jgi:hypothetical protein
MGSATAADSQVHDLCMHVPPLRRPCTKLRATRVGWGDTCSAPPRPGGPPPPCPAHATVVLARLLASPRTALGAGCGAPRNSHIDIELAMADPAGAGCQVCGAGLGPLRSYFRRTKICEVGKSYRSERQLPSHICRLLHISLTSFCAGLPRGRGLDG